MRLVRSLRPVEVHGRIPRIIRWPPVLLILALKTLQASPRLDQRAVHDEVLVTGQVLLPRLAHHLAQDSRTTSPSNGRSRFLVNTVTSQTGSPRFLPTNHRSSTL